MTLLTALKATGKFAKKNVGGMVTIAGHTYGVASAYNEARDNGAGVVGASAQGLTAEFLPNLIGQPAHLAWQGANLAKQAFLYSNQKAREYSRFGTESPFAFATHVDTKQTYTMRQAGLSQIQQNMFNTKKAMMGNEAMFLHR
ncbi:hypothetical protein MKY88_24010 [Lysinibacillus sp. FSL R7-0073]|uniref:hypothetical protein n=1 Tax=Lysinibacillus sp. FSL R7-0073 TaxID=2921669 RepID=UPI0030F7F946